MTDEHLFEPDLAASLFNTLDTLPTTPLDLLSLPRELAPGVIAYPDCLRVPECAVGEEEDLCGVCAARSRRPDAVTGAGGYENLPDAVDRDSAEARRAMFRGFGWGVTE